MGKNKTRQNVFKVAGSRSLKAKNKPKAVTVQLKKITKNIVQNKTEEVNAQLQSLQTIVRQSEPAKKADAPVVNRSVESVDEAVKSYESKLKKTEDTLEALAGFSVDS